MEARFRKVSYQKCSTPPHQKLDLDAHQSNAGLNFPDGKCRDVPDAAQKLIHVKQIEDAQIAIEGAQRNLGDGVGEEETPQHSYSEPIGMRRRHRSGNEETNQQQSQQPYGDAISRLKRLLFHTIIFMCQTFIK